MASVPNIFELKTKLNKFLNEHPELKAEQAKIDAMLKGAGSQHNRNVLLQHMMMAKIGELKKALEELKIALNSKKSK